MSVIYRRSCFRPGGPCSIRERTFALVFKDLADYGRIEQGDRLVIKDAMGCLKGGAPCVVEDATRGGGFEVVSNMNEREAELILKGGLLPNTREKTS